MIYGIGTDIVSLKRIIRLNKNSDRRLQGAYSLPKSCLNFRRRANPSTTLPNALPPKKPSPKPSARAYEARFPSATSASGTTHWASPNFSTTALSEWLEEQGISRVSLSMADEGDTVLAFAVAEK